jgi:hypothetical protein
VSAVDDPAEAAADDEDEDHQPRTLIRPTSPGPSAGCSGISPAPTATFDLWVSHSTSCLRPAPDCPHQLYFPCYRPIKLYGRASDLEVVEVLETQPATLNVQPVELGESLQVGQPSARQGDADERKNLEVGRALQVAEAFVGDRAPIELEHRQPGE